MVIIVIGLFLLPWLLGVLYQNIMKYQGSMILVYIEGNLLFFAIAGILAMPAIKWNWSFEIYRNLLAIVFLAAAMAAVFGICQKKDKKKVSLEISDKKWLIPVAIVFLALLAVFFIYEPVVRDDATAEVIHTTMETETLFRYHPFTGEELVFGMYPASKLVVLPLIYSALCFFSKVDVEIFLYRIVPGWMLLLHFLIVWEWTGLLWKTKKEIGKRWIMLCLYGVLQLFGDYLFITASYRLLHTGWMGETIWITFLLPFAGFLWMDFLQKGKRSNWPTILLCCITGIFMAPWKLVIFMSVMLLLTFAGVSLFRRIDHAGSS